MRETLRIQLFKNGSRELFHMLAAQSIPMDMKRSDPGTIMASGEVIEIIKVVGGVSLIPSIALIVIQWMKNKASRKIMIQTKKKEIVEIQGMSIDEVTKLLEIAESVTAIQTKPDE
jgi:hypothetical protein